MTEYNLTIGENKWSLKFADDIIVYDKPQGDKRTYGICDNDNKVIAVAEGGVSRNEIELTLIHEIVHAVAFEWEIDIPENAVEEIARVIKQIGFNL